MLAQSVTPERLPGGSLVPHDLLTPRVLRERLGISVTTEWRWRRLGLPYLGGHGRALRYSWAEVTQWLRQRPGLAEPPLRGEG